MNQAAPSMSCVLAGFEIGTDAKIIRWPDRFMSERGVGEAEGDREAA